jgi:hypothetical protein
LLARLFRKQFGTTGREGKTMIYAAHKTVGENIIRSSLIMAGEDATPWQSLFILASKFLKRILLIAVAG